ncbi:MAG: 16S rRNA (guanine(966)-N(2))-methyltransferase RsmD [Ruminococcaceae bacterium]|nr:16S rRNA (guanine(966)-N(2))-methyltransferase RsmD [Oscillospiraceae bacterium]
MMRIITGSARGTKLMTLEGENTRPTSERVKESVFSMLQFDIEGRRVLDLFGGSGQLALEALSRGAAQATVVDASPDAVKIIKANAQKTKLYDKCVILTKDYKAFLKGSKEKFDIIFLDPPYDSNMLEESLRLIIDQKMINYNGFIILESDKDEIPEYGNLTLHRHSKQGRAYITVLINEVEGDE